MSNNIIIWAQALDNQSPDCMEADGNKLSPEEKKDHHSKISSITKRGTKAYDSCSNKLFVRSEYFVLSFDSNEKDIDDRASPITIYGKHLDDYEKKIYEYLDLFCKKHSRSYNKDQVETLLNEISKHYKKRLIRIATATTMGVTAIVMLLKVPAVVAVPAIALPSFATATYLKNKK